MRVSCVAGWQGRSLSLSLSLSLVTFLLHPSPRRPAPSHPILDQVTMTDLPEALPILRHNTDATFATLDVGVGNNRDDGHSSESREACRRPTIQRLCWGDAVDAGQVAAAAATAASAVEGGSTEWQGFDLIVVRDEGGPKRPSAVRLLSTRYGALSYGLRQGGCRRSILA